MSQFSCSISFWVSDAVIGKSLLSIWESNKKIPISQFLKYNFLYSWRCVTTDNENAINLPMWFQQQLTKIITYLLSVT